MGAEESVVEEGQMKPSVDPNGVVFRDYKNPGVVWRNGVPDYSKVDKTYIEHRENILVADSLEHIVTKVVKNWEIEEHHVPDINQWITMDTKNLELYTNELKNPVDAAGLAKVGSYAFLLGKCPHFNGSKETFESADKMFNNAFNETGFAWEVIKVYSGPPDVTFTFRHFGRHTGDYVDSDGQVFKPSGKMVVFTGTAIANVDENLVIKSIRLFWDRLNFINQLTENKA